MCLYKNPGESGEVRFERLVDIFYVKNPGESGEVRFESLVKDSVFNCVYANTLGKVVTSGSKAS